MYGVDFMCWIDIGHLFGYHYEVKGDIKCIFFFCVAQIHNSHIVPLGLEKLYRCDNLCP